jgi:LacI family transcriptional regulator
MRARLKDVAARAGVATNTASTILNRRSNSWASKETAARVFKAAEELGYKPSRAALGLRMGSFKTIGLVIPDLHNPFYTAFADCLERELRPHGYDLIVEHSRNDIEYEMHCLESILDRQIDAVTYFVSDFDKHLKFLEMARKAGKSVVAMTGPSTDDAPFPFDSVEIDFSVGLIDAVEHLLELKHEKFGFLCALAKGQEAGDRPEVFNQLLRERGIPEESNVFIPCAHDLESARNTFGAFLDEHSGARPTALIAMNDLTAIGAMRAASERGIRVPEDLSVIGIDNIPLGDYLYRRLTSIAQPLEELAKATAELLLNRLDENTKDDQPRAKKFKAKLILKDTTSRPPR